MKEKLIFTRRRLLALFGASGAVSIGTGANAQVDTSHCDIEEYIGRTRLRAYPDALYGNGGTRKVVRVFISYVSQDDPLPSIGFHFTHLGNGLVAFSHTGPDAISIDVYTRAAIFRLQGAEIARIELRPCECGTPTPELIGGDDTAERIVHLLRSGHDLEVELTDGDREKGTIDAAVFQAAYDTLSKKADVIYRDFQAGICRDDCFFTTAVCHAVGLEDQSWELQTLRQFRDGWMSRTAERRAAVLEYYRTAPQLVKALKAEPGRRTLKSLYPLFIVPCVLLIRVGLSRAAYRHYARMIDYIRARVHVAHRV